MQGSFDITCQQRPDGTSAIGKQSVSSPWHLSKPYWDGQVLLIQVVNATAGIFSGDHLTLNVDVEAGASILLTSPSASRIHTMLKGEASLKQSIHVASNSWVEWMPELFIPHKKCRYWQATEIRADKNAQMFFVETLAPGRVFFGEKFAFHEVKWSTRLWYDNKLILAESYPLSPSNQSLHDLTKGSHPRYFASAMLIHPEVNQFKEWQKVIAEWTNDSVKMGATQLAPAVYLFRMLTNSSEQLKSLLQQLRLLLSDGIPQLKQSARKL